MNAELDGQSQFGTDAICTRDQYGSSVAVDRQFKEAAKATDTTEHAGPVSAGDVRFDSLDKGVSGVDIDTSVRIGHSFGVRASRF